MVRIIAGEFGSRRLRAPRGVAVRPTADRVKESLFSVLGPRVAGARVLDLCAGTGNLGIEALSRGAATCLFVEKSPAACLVLRDNIAALGLGERAAVLRLDAARALELPTGPAGRFTLVFVDPPYATGARAPHGGRGAPPGGDTPRVPRLRNGASEFRKILLALDGCATLARGAFVAAEHCRFDEPPDGLRVLRMLEQRRYGETALSFFTVP